MSRASSDALDALHALVADTLTGEIKKARGSEDGISPQLISQALKFLKDNGVDAPASSPRFDSLAAELQDLDLDQIAQDVRH